MDELIKQAEALGIKVDKRWKEERLREEIAKVQPAEPVVEEVEAEQEEAVEDPSAEAAEGSEEEAATDPAYAAEAAQQVAGVTIKNLTENANKRLGIGAGETLTLTSEQLADRQFMARIDHGVATGVLGIV